MIKKILQVFVLLPLMINSYGQLTPISDQYMLNPLLINPAHAGGRGALSLAAFYRRQWVGIKGAPETLTLTVDAPIPDRKLGLGLSLITDKIGVTKENSFNSYYSYKIMTGEGHLSFGLKAGLITTNTKWSDLIVLDPGDDLYLADSRVFVVPDFSFGTYFSYKKYFAGFSIPRLLSYKFDFDRNKYSLRVKPGEYYYLFNTGYLFEIAPEINFFPSTLISVSPGEKAIIDLNAHFSFFDKMWLGTSYRSNNSMSGLIQFAVYSKIKVAYSYYFDFSRLGSFNNGSHEIMIRYEFLYKADVVNPLIF